jgi:plasmid stabilization system protein ParE
MTRKLTEAFPQVYGETRRALLERFPYGIYFISAILNDEVIVLAVLHGRRHPRRWQSRF